MSEPMQFPESPALLLSLLLIPGELFLLPDGAWRWTSTVFSTTASRCTSSRCDRCVESRPYRRARATAFLIQKGIFNNGGLALLCHTTSINIPYFGACTFEGQTEEEPELNRLTKRTNKLVVVGDDDL